MMLAKIAPELRKKPGRKPKGSEQGRFAKTFRSLFSNPRFIAARRQEPRVLDVLIQVQFCVFDAASRVIVPMSEEDIDGLSYLADVTIEQFRNGLRALTDKMKPNTSTDLVMQWDEQAGTLTFDNFDPYLDRYLSILERDKRRPKRDGNAHIEGDSAVESQSICESPLAREREIEIQSEKQIEIPSGQRRAGTRERGKTTTTTTKGKSKTGKKTEEKRPRKKTRLAPICKNNAHINSVRSKTRKPKPAADRLGELTVEQHREAVIAFFAALPTERTRLLAELHPLVAADRGIAAALCEIEAWAIANVQRLIEFAETDKREELHVWGLIERWLAEEEGKLRGDPPAGAKGAIERWVSEVREDKGNTPAANAAVAEIRAAGGKMLYCKKCKRTVARENLVTPPSYVPARHLNEPPSDLLFNSCPKCHTEIPGAWAEYATAKG